MVLVWADWDWDCGDVESEGVDGWRAWCGGRLLELGDGMDGMTCKMRREDGEGRNEALDGGCDMGYPG